MTDPRRLADDPATGAELREMLGAARADRPSAAASARMMSRLDALGAAPAAPAGSAAIWIAVAIAGAVAIGALVVYLVAGSGDPGRAGAAPPAAADPPGAAPRAAAPPAAPAPEAPQPEHPAAPQPAPVAPPPQPAAPPPATTAGPEPAAPAPAPPTELALVRRARAALARGDHAAALAASDQHRRHYRAGALAEEREAIAIEALAGLDRRADAAARLRRFRSAFPAASYTARLAELVR